MLSLRRPVRTPPSWLPVLLAFALLLAATMVPSSARAGSPSVLSVAGGSNPGAAASGGPTPPASPSGTQVVAGGIPDWINVTRSGPGAAPSASYSASSAYDPVDHLTVLFGGCGNPVCPSGETWVFADGLWTNVTIPSNSPPARSAASMDWDANLQGVLLFGGEGAAGALNDTWLYAGGRWTNLTWVSPAPPARSGAMMAFDPQPEENGSVLFGGLLANGLTTNDTWVWEGWSGWVRFAPSTAPAPVESAGYAYSPSDGYILLFGGVEVCGFLCFGVVNQTWEFYAGEWWPTNGKGAAPTARAGPAMTYDAGLGEIVLFGGFNATLAYPVDTWTYAGGSWSLASTSGSPPSRAYAAISDDAGSVAPLVFGGSGPSASLNDTWVFEPVPTVTLSVSPATVETSAPVSVSVAVAGGSAPYRTVLDFGDTTSALLAGSGPFNPQIHVYASAGAIVLTANLTDAVGAKAATSTPTITVVSGPDVSIAAPMVRADVGTRIALRAMGSGGSAPLTFSWVFGDGSTGTGANVSHAYTTVGRYTATVNVTDGLGGRASASTAVVIGPLPSATAAAAPASATIGATVTFFANLTGGTAPFAYAWTFGDGNMSGSPNPIHGFPRAGTYVVQLWVNDSGGGSAHGTVTVTIASASVVAAGGPPVWFWAGLAVLIAIGAMAAALLLLRPRRPAKPSEALQNTGYPEDEL